MQAWFDKSYPLIISLITGYLGFRMWNQTINDRAVSAIPELVSVAAITIGFIATALALIMSLGSVPLIIRLKEAGVYSTITKYLWKPIIYSFWVVSISIFLKIVNGVAEFTCLYKRWGISILVFLSTFMLLTTYRGIHLLYKVLRGIDNQE